MMLWYHYLRTHNINKFGSLTMYLTAGHFKFTDAGLPRARELMNKIVEIGRSEEGIVQYTFYPNPDKDNAWFLFEEWESREAHDAHFESDAMQALVPEFFELLAEEPSVSYFDATLVSSL